ncbi:MAG: thiamine pyrophosphate-binding protein [Syntrophomonadaceae bacterium]|nr:thiamine pyrophosphate-binding protein [Syntrophomonadaceae bacterium]
MKQRASDYVAQLLVEYGINNVFTVVGGGAMHLNDALGYNSNIECIYNHHEQASAIAAESYARVNNKMAVVCVTTGPGGTNAITGVLCAWQDNIPLLVLSGQVRYNTTVESTGLNLRQFGEQEHYIVQTVQSITKYAVTVKDVSHIKYHIEKAIYLANHGRRGPCWVDIPLDVQGAIIEIDELEGYVPEFENGMPFAKERFLQTINMAKRPVILAGSAIRTANAHQEFLRLVDELKIPVVASTSNSDLFPCSGKYYFGNFGVFGGRAGNFIVQNADCLISLGCRLSFKQTGFNFEGFAPLSKKIVVDVDINELKKETIKIDIPICIDLKDFINEIKDMELSFDLLDLGWIKYCEELKEQFPIFQAKHAISNHVNPYYFAEELKKFLPDDSICVVGNSCACVSVLQSGTKEKNQRLWGNVNCGTMGYDLPAAIGAAIAAKKMIICITGDGSIQMNIQELQTIVHNRLPIKIFIFNNFGYNAIMQTHTNFFGRLTGCTQESGISFPDFKSLAYAYQIPYYKCETNKELGHVLNKFLENENYGICEIIEDSNQPIEPKIMSKALEDGRIISPPIDDLAPFLGKELYRKYSSYAK